MALPYASSANQPFGSRTITIGGVTYRVQNWNPTVATRRIRRNNTDGDQSEFQIRREPADNSATLQLATSATTRPVGGTTFAVGAVTYVVMDVQVNEPEGEYHTVEMQYTEESIL